MPHPDITPEIIKFMQSQPLPVIRPVAQDLSHLPWYKRVWKLFTFKRHWEVVEDYYMHIPWLGITIFIPEGFDTDFASVPRVFWPILSPTGVLLMGSLPHDMGYRYEGLLTFCMASGQTSFTPMTKLELDALIADITYSVSGSKLPGWAAQIGLTLGGFLAWGNARLANRNVFTDYKELLVL